MGLRYAIGINTENYLEISVKQIDSNTNIDTFLSSHKKIFSTSLMDPFDYITNLNDPDGWSDFFVLKYWPKF